MTTLSTHVLDTASGHPASGIRVDLYRKQGTGWEAAGSGVTDAEGRIRSMAEGLLAGEHLLVFHTGPYLGKDAFYPEVSVVFRIEADDPHYHIPLLLSGFGYSTYRGS